MWNYDIRNLIVRNTFAGDARQMLRSQYSNGTAPLVVKGLRDFDVFGIKKKSSSMYVHQSYFEVVTMPQGSTWVPHLSLAKKCCRAICVIHKQMRGRVCQSCRTESFGH